MVTTQLLLAATDDSGGPVDYYAGITAVCVVILFAKFTTHGARAGKSQEIGSKTFKCWQNWHYLCVFLAWPSLALSLFVLGWGLESERVMRLIVAILALMASFILAVDMVMQ